MANNGINVDHGTFMNVLIGGVFSEEAEIEKKRNNPGQ